MNLSDDIERWLRTVVPIIIGALITAVSRRLGVDLDSEAAVNLTLPLVIMGYYALIRLLERRWKWVGWFIGAPKTA